jgi:diguanylate cyclase
MLSQKAYEMALIDPLTKVYNRNMLETLNEHRKFHPDCISFAMIDIDDFKIINDNYGHQKGDKILRMLGELIKKNIRTDDICVRYGGEEFLLAFKNTDNETALKILERIKSSFCEQIFYRDGKEIFCTISVGLALGDKDEDNESIISNADKALYQAKRNGKNSIMTYSNAS